MMIYPRKQTPRNMAALLRKLKRRRRVPRGKYAIAWPSRFNAWRRECIDEVLLTRYLDQKSV